jgi:hypothetical protein
MKAMTVTTDKDKELASVQAKIETIKKAGFGEVRILIRNGTIYRILTTEDEVIKKD